MPRSKEVHGIVSAALSHRRITYRKRRQRRKI